MSDTSDTQIVLASREVLTRHARTFRLAGRLLSRQQLDEAAVVYAFCRLVDDTVDEAPDGQAARLGLRALSDEVEGARPASPLVGAFLQVCQRRAIPEAAALELIKGVGSDLEVVRVADDGELLRYCYRVAGTVGLMMCGVIGVTAPEATPHAIDLGIGMQLTNICRDVIEDAGRDRVYLPATRLAAAGVSHEALLSRQAPTAPVGQIVDQLLTVAEDYYRSGDAGMRYIPTRPRCAIGAAGRMYRAIGLKLQRRGCDVYAGRTVVGPLSKALWLGAGLWQATRATWGAPIPHDPTLHRHLAGLPGANAPRALAPGAATEPAPGAAP